MTRGPTVLVRAAEFADIDPLAFVLTRTFLESQAPFIPEPLDPSAIAAFSRDLVTRRAENMAVASLDGRLVGMAYVEARTLEAINVLPEFQRRGIGDALLRWAESRIQGQGYSEASLDTQEANAPARAFYERRGYRVTRAWNQTAFTKTPIPTVTMCKQLAADPGPAT